ncbi:hypothetical protein OCK02_00960 [Rhizobium sp. TRM96647]|uniref:hypothetical protein n=1 Tax=unclassified Rhizobium TaxID=2613769 RepID=UPI0021E843FC|nr:MULTISPECIES: hypothetical protein [unclassified Rhizobium]MCV3734756.1 hypothetical protein [Rhizobium sp. TRM96647]MCV3757126.1 hypothetical protein [Rhizobium sp. TRM96650]
MDPEKPPRRKKSATPVTIDLEAAPATAEAKTPPAPGEPDVVTASAGTDATRTEARIPEQKSPDKETPEQALPEQGAAGDVITGKTTAEQETIGREPFSATDEPAPEPAADTGPDAAAPAFEEPPTEPRHEQQFEAAPPPHAVQPPSKSGAFAAAIVGGLVALAGAGALQYGGYLPALGPGARTGSELAPLSAELEALKSQVNALRAAASSPAADLQPVESRLAALEQAAANPVAGGIDEAAQQSIATLQATVGKLSTDVAALGDRAAAAERAVSDQSAQLSERIDAAEQKLAEPRDDVAMARAVAATALKTAIERGGPYLAELEAYASVSPDDPSIAPLREQAPTGVPSRADLVRQFQPVADQMIEAVHRPTGEQGIVDRLLASASSVITVRPVGSVEGDSPEAIVARIENKLQNGDLKGAQIEWQALPETARNAGAPFRAELDRRIAVEDGVGAIVSGAMAKNGNQG